MDTPTASSLTWLDQWLNRSWSTVPVDHQWLLLQTLATTPSRRTWIETWPVGPGQSIVDLGCGPGIMAQEMAVIKGCRVTGYDQDGTILDLAQSLNHLLGQEDQVKFRKRDLLREPGQADADLVVSRFVAQYMTDLVGFFRQIATYATPGGLIAIEDVDDGYLIEHPAPPEAWASALKAFQSYQNGPQGDRFVGRKLAEAGVESGLQLESIHLNPAVFSGRVEPHDATVQFDIDRIERVLPYLISHGHLDQASWINAKAVYRDSFPHFSYISTATVRVLFRVP